MRDASSYSAAGSSALAASFSLAMKSGPFFGSGAAGVGAAGGAGTEDTAADGAAAGATIAPTTSPAGRGASLVPAFATIVWLALAKAGGVGAAAADERLAAPGAATFVAAGLSSAGLSSAGLAWADLGSAGSEPAGCCVPASALGMPRGGTVPDGAGAGG